MFTFFPSPAEPAAPVETPTFLIAGLGNPGRRYQKTRHNIGFMTLDHLAKRLGESFTRVESKALVAKAMHQGCRLILVKPQTYMNDSGKAIGALVRFYKIPCENLMIVYDDVDLPIGTLRMRPTGGSAGQKGMKSIIQHLGTQDFPRLRIGIDRPPGRMDAAAYVLQPFAKDETDIIQAALESAADSILAYVTQGLENAMNRYNG